MKKFNEILNENNEGYYDHTAGVKLVVADYKLIKEEMFPLLEEVMNKNTAGHKIIYDVTHWDEGTRLVKNSKGEPEIKYLRVQFSVNVDSLWNTELDIIDFFSNIKKNLSEIIKIKDNKIRQGKASQYFLFSFDYQDFKNSNYFKNNSKINRYGT